MFSDSFDRSQYARELQARLRALRGATEFTQQQVAEKLGIVRSTYVGYENGTKELPWEKCLAICFFYASIPESRALLVHFHLLPSENGRQDA